MKIDMFENSKKEFMDCIHQEIGDYWTNYSESIIYFEGKHWIIKSNTSNPEEKNLSLLAYLLGKGWINIPEVRLLSQDEFHELSKKVDILGEGASRKNTYLVRLIQDYSCRELNVQNLDDAMASEIAFSCWIHRRDACFGNRAFICSIPMFFDFNIAFGVDTGDFFRSGPDAGHAGNWGFWYIENVEALGNLVLLRHLEWEKSFAAIPVVNRSHFEAAIQKHIKHIQGFRRNKLLGLVKNAGFSEQKSLLLTDFLCKSSKELNAGIKKIISIMDENNFNLLYIDNSKYRPVNRSDYFKIVHAPHPPYLSQEIVQEILRLQNRLSAQENAVQFSEKKDNSVYNNSSNGNEKNMFPKKKCFIKNIL